MAVSEQNENKARTTIDMVRASCLDAGMKEDLEDIITETKENTNGRTAEEKLQSVCLSQFHLARLISSVLVQKSTEPRRGWKDVIIECKWQIVCIACIVCALLAYRPQLSAVIENFTK